MQERKKKLKCEIYRDIPGYEGLYQVSNLGNVKSVRNNKVLSQTNHKEGYKLVSVSVNSKHKELTVHRLVALAFIQNPKGYRDVNHKDGNKSNNVLENLEWVSHSENIKHSYEVLKQKRNSKPVRCIDTGEIYDSCKDASTKTGINVGSINHVVNGLAKRAGGMIWERL